MTADPPAAPSAPPAGDRLVAPTHDLPAHDIPLARELEELAHRAWPPLREERLGGWVLRESGGSSRRGNSVWARGDVDDLDAALAQVRSFYAAAGLPATFQITPLSRPAGLAAALDRAGFDDSGPTDVCVADLAGLRSAAAAAQAAAADADGVNGAGGRAGAPVAVELLERAEPDERWLAVAGEVLSTFAAQRAGTLAVLRRTPLPQCYVTVLVDGRPLGVGRGVRDGDWLGIYSMATLPAARGRGIARRVLAALADWAAAGGASRAYLQVEQTSTAARGLYADLGFRPVYRYRYRRLSVPPPVPADLGEGPGTSPGAGPGTSPGAGPGAGLGAGLGEGLGEGGVR